MKTNYEIRTCRSLQAGDKMALEGYAARFNQPSKDMGGFIETIKPGAFSNALAKGQDVRCLFNHSADRVLGRTKSGTLTLAEDENGLKFRCQLDPNNSEHRNLYSSVKRGDLSEMSFAFTPDGPDGDYWDNVKDAKGNWIVSRELRKVNLFDVSLVTTPAYDGTSCAARAIDNLAVEKRSQVKKLFLKKLFGESAEDRRLAAIAKRNGITVEALLDAENRVNAARLADEIHREQGELKRRLTADEVYELRRKVAAAEPDDDGFGPCADDDDDSEEHERAAERHGNCARRCAERRDAARADLHYAASDAHRLAAQRKSTDPDFADIRFRCGVACQRAVNFSNGMKNVGS